MDESKEEKEKGEEKKKDFSDILTLITSTLKDDIKEVSTSKKLVDSPACLVTATDAMSTQMEQIMKSMGQAMPDQKKILEVNLDHPVLVKMQDMFKVDPKSPKLKDFALLLYEQASLAE